MTLTSDTSRDEPRRLDADTVSALATHVDAAKARGWQQSHLKRWFAARGVEHAPYKAALAGEVVESAVASELAAISIHGLPAWPYAPSPDDIAWHIEWLVAPARGAFDDALVEIAYEPAPDRGPSAARLFGLDELKAAMEFAVSKNMDGCNVYIGAALRLPDADRNKRASAEDFYVATAVPIDIDRDYDTTRAAMAAVCDDGLVVTTGLTPQRRSQHWTRLVEPCDSDIEFGHAFRGLVEHVGADMAVKDAARVMRLGGTLAFPNARKVGLGYCIELTTTTLNDAARPSSLDALRSLAASEATGPRRDYSDRPQTSQPDGIERAGILGTGKVTNGRERFFATKLLPRVIRQWQEETGADPSVDELWTEAYALFEAEADNSDERWTCPDGQQQLRARVANTLRRLRLGRMARIGLASIETGVGADEAREAQAAFEAARPFVADEEEAAAAAVDEAQAGVIRASPYAWIDAAKIPPRDVLYGRHLFRKFLSATVAPGGLGKSSLVMVEALAMVTGRTLIGEAPKAALSAWYWNGEDPMEELQRRIAAACLHFDISHADLGDRLFIDSGRDTEIIVVREDRNGVHVAEPVVEALISEVRRNHIDVLIIDPFIAAHAVSENDNTKIEAVVKQWMRVAEEGGCAVELVHHVRKPSGGAQETTVDDARGAGALLAKVRSARVLNPMTTTEADELGIDRKDRFRFFRVDNGKANLMPRGGDARWRRMLGVPLGNRIDVQEDEVGVVTEWQKPSALEGVTATDLMKVKVAVSAGEWREDVRAANWVGQAVGGALGIDVDQPQGVARVKSLIRTWVKTGALEVVQGLDAARRPKQFVIVGKGEE
jgi:hypothetical protein